MRYKEQVNLLIEIQDALALQCSKWNSEMYEIQRLIIVTEQLCLIKNTGKILEETESTCTIVELKEWLEEVQYNECTIEP